MRLFCQLYKFFAKLIHSDCYLFQLGPEDEGIRTRASTPREKEAKARGGICLEKLIIIPIECGITLFYCLAYIYINKMKEFNSVGCT